MCVIYLKHFLLIVNISIMHLHYLGREIRKMGLLANYKYTLITLSIEYMGMRSS